MLSASKEIEPGVRAMLLLAPDLFRLDVMSREDTLRIMVRNLSSGALRTRSTFGGYSGPSVVFGEAELYEPTHSRLDFSLGDGQDRVEVEVVVGTIKFVERGLMRVSGQAVVRPAPAS